MGIDDSIQESPIVITEFYIQCQGILVHVALHHFIKSDEYYYNYIFDGYKRFSEKVTAEEIKQSKLYTEERCREFFISKYKLIKEVV